MDRKFIALISIAIISIFITDTDSINKNDSEQSNNFYPYEKYKNITPLKQDLFKQAFVVILTLTLFEQLPLFDAEKPWFSIIGRACAVGSCFVIYHSILKPVVNLLPRF
jgi:hypothetical protein